MNLSIKPSVGVARLGNSKGQFYLAPDEIGGLPYEADNFGNKKGPVQKFKDAAGQVRRQGQPFTIHSETGEEITLNTEGVKSIEWTVHVANKKAAWYQYSELDGNLLYGNENSYTNRKVEFRNATVEGENDRRGLIVDPGPRTVSGKNDTAEFNKDGAPSGYPVSFPNPDVSNGTPITTLGNLITDDDGRLIVLGGYGHAGGDEPLVSYGGSDTWHDDIADGPVYCTVTYENGDVVEMSAWVIVGSPDFAPELVNISNLSDTMFDVGVRCFDLVPSMYSNGQYNTEFVVNYQRDILPIIQRLGRYQWVANVQSMMAFTSNVFDFSDPSEGNKANRMNYFSYFRQLNDKSSTELDQPQSHLFKENGDGLFPMMPLNSGSNSVSNETIVKFLSLDETQYFLLQQWAEGTFESNPDFKPYPVSSADMASVGNCVGLPMCPGIEVTWSLQNPTVYSSPFQIADFKGKNGYNKTGLTPSRDECEGNGCEPGDLTKRMACPWQADFFQCTIQTVNFTNLAFNKDTLVQTEKNHLDRKWTGSGESYQRDTVTVNESTEPLPPSYYSYWWPPQSPWDVLGGDFTLEEQENSNIPGGQQVNYARGINNFVQMVEHWSSLAFIRDRNQQDQGFPYFTETERNHELFSYTELPVSQVSGNSQDDGVTIPVFYIESNTKIIEAKGDRAKKMVQSLEKRSFKKIAVAHGGLPKPRSGTRARR